MRFLFDSVSSKDYWTYLLFSRDGWSVALTTYGILWGAIQTLDFFGVYTRVEYDRFAFIWLFLISVVIGILFHWPRKCIEFKVPERDQKVVVRIQNIFDVNGAVMVSTNTNFEADVAGGRIDPKSLQGQFTDLYFRGNQQALQHQIQQELTGINGVAPYPIGTTIRINTHNRNFYLTAMAHLNDKGNAYTTLDEVESALQGLWKFVEESGSLETIVLPVVGTGRGRLNVSRKRLILLIAESYLNASNVKQFARELVIVVDPKDARSFAVNLYDIRDLLRRAVTA